MGDPRLLQPSPIAKRLDNAATKRSTLWSSKGKHCKPSLHASTSVTARCTISSLRSASAAVRDERPFFAAVPRVRPADNHRGPRSDPPAIADCFLLAWDRLRSIRGGIAGFFLLLCLLTQFGFDRMVRDAGYPGSRRISLATPCSACSSSSSATTDATATATTPFRRNSQTLRRPSTSCPRSPFVTDPNLLREVQNARFLCCANANFLCGNHLVELLRFVEYWHSQRPRPHWLCFDFKLTNDPEITCVNQSDISFITICRRGTAVTHRREAAPTGAWCTAYSNEARLGISVDFFHRDCWPAPFVCMSISMPS